MRVRAAARVTAGPRSAARVPRRRMRAPAVRTWRIGVAERSRVYPPSGAPRFARRSWLRAASKKCPTRPDSRDLKNTAWTPSCKPARPWRYGMRGIRPTSPERAAKQASTGTLVHQPTRDLCKRAHAPRRRQVHCLRFFQGETSASCAWVLGTAANGGRAARFGCACVRSCVWVVSARKGTQSWPRRTSALTQAANAWSRRVVRTESTVASTVRRQGNRRNFTAAANIWHADDAGATGMPRVWCYGPTPHGVIILLTTGMSAISVPLRRPQRVGRRRTS
jgi:hypothetical protein